MEDDLLDVLSVTVDDGFDSDILSDLPAETVLVSMIVDNGISFVMGLLLVALLLEKVEKGQFCIRQDDINKYEDENETKISYSIMK